MKVKTVFSRFLGFMLALVLMVGILPMGQVIRAESTLPTISNVAISSDGVLTWDAVEGATRYSVSVANFGGYVDETSYDLKYNCNYFNTGSGTKNIHLVAKDADKNSIAEWYGSYDYVDDRPQLAKPTNIRLEGPILKWDPVPNATYYVIDIIGDSNKRHQVTDTFYVYDTLSDGSTYMFEVAACGLEYSFSAEIVELTYTKVLYPITVTNGTAKDGYMRILTEAEQGTDVILFADAVPEGNVFRGWRLGGVEVEEPKNSVIGFTMPGNAVTATALYGVPYTVTVENGICTATGTSTGQFFEGDTVYVEAYDAPQGYRLKGWTSNDVTIPNISVLTTSFTMPNKDVTVRAVYAPLSLTVTFDANGHGTAPAAQTVESGKTATKPADPTANGWTFGGWYMDDACTKSFDFSTTVTQNITLYAKWTKNETVSVYWCGLYTSKSQYGKVELNNDGYISETSADNYTSGTEMTAFAHPDEGYHFKEWQNSIGDVVSTSNPYSFTLNSNTKLYAIFEEDTAITPATFTVAFDANGHGTAPSAQIIESGNTAVKPANPSEDGWTFGGWYTDVACNNYFDFSTVITEDITLYAKWTKNEIQSTYWAGVYTSRSTHGQVDLDKINYASTQLGQHFAAGTELTAYAYPDEGYRFKEWQNDAGDVVSTSNPYSFTLNSNTNLYAIFEEGTEVATEYVITVKDGIATLDGAGISKVTMGTTITLIADAAPEGMEFDKWVVVKGGVSLADASSPTTTFEMPASEVSIEATYKVQEIPHTHVLSAVAAKEPTCTADGNIEYYECGCGKWFSDSEGTTEITDHSSVVLPKHHTYNDTLSYDDEYHYYECVNGDDKKDSATHAFVWIIDTEATTTSAGSKHEECACGYKRAAVTIPMLAPSIILGNKQTVKLDGISDATFVSNAKYDDFKGVEIDDVLISSDKYTAVSGSIKVTLKADYLSTLSEGEHKIAILSNDDAAVGTFTVEKSTSNPDNDPEVTPKPNPGTGGGYAVPDMGVRDREKTNLLVFGVSASLAAIALFERRRKYTK